ncbi:MAG TPA: TIGR00266 family protein [Herpetosiphonaceae bacterium]
MQCTSCGTDLQPGMNFCSRCGTRVAASQPAAATGPTTFIGGDGDFQSQAGQRLDLPDPKVIASGEGKTGMDYQIVGTTMQAAIIQLEPGQTIFSETGGMAWMSGNVIMNTNAGGGGGGIGGMLGGMVKRALSGESLFIVDYTVQGGRGLVAFASEFPGKIIPLHLGPGQSMIMQRDAFMCAEKTVTLEMHFRRNLGSGFFGGEGFVMQRATGPGVVFAELDGEIVEYTLEAGQVLKVDTGHVAMLEPTVQFDVEMIRGFRNILFGGEGLFLATLRGPGRVWLQTMPAMNLAKKIANYLPRTNGSGGSQGGMGNIGNLGNFFGGD